MVESRALPPRWVSALLLGCLLTVLGGILLSAFLYVWSTYVRSVPLVLVTLPAVVGVVFTGVLLLPLKYVGRDYRWTLWPPQSK